MGRQRFRDTGKDTFFGHFVYDRVVPQDHFLRRLNDLVDWEGISRKLTRYYEGGGSYGRAPYEPAMLLKMLLVPCLCSLSERQVEELANDTLSVKYFLGLGVDEKAPDHSTLTVFKQRLLEGGDNPQKRELRTQTPPQSRFPGAENSAQKAPQGGSFPNGSLFQQSLCGYYSSPSLDESKIYTERSSCLRDTQCLSNRKPTSTLFALYQIGAGLASGRSSPCR